MTSQTQWIGGSYEAACGANKRPKRTSVVLLDAITEAPGITVSELSMKLQIRNGTIHNSLARMLKRGEVTRRMSKPYKQQGDGQLGHWYAADHTFHEAA